MSLKPTWRGALVLAGVLLVVLVAIAVAATNYVPDVWQPTTSTWINGNAAGYTEGEVAPVRVQITDDDGLTIAFSVCLDKSVSVNGAYGFSTTAPWDTTYTPTVQPPDPNNLTAAAEGFAIENGTFSAGPSFVNLSDGSAAFRCPADYLEWQMSVDLPTNAGNGDKETAVVVVGAKLAAPGDQTRDGDVVPAGLGASKVNGVFQIRFENGGEETINFTAIAASGKLEVVKELVPDTDPGLFDLQIDGVTLADDVGDGGTTGEQTVGVATHTVGEVAGSGTNLADYGTSITCVDAAGATVASGQNTTSLDVDVEAGDDIVCTITNTNVPTTGELIVIKDAQPDDPQDFAYNLYHYQPQFGLLAQFSLDDDGVDSNPLSNTYQTTVSPGKYGASEAGNPAWNIDIKCVSTDSNRQFPGLSYDPNNNGTGIAFDIAAGETITCTFINTRKTAEIEVIKVLQPADDAGKFNLLINGVTYATDVGDGGTTGKQTVYPGLVEFSETAGTGTDLSDYNITYECLPRFQPVSVTPRPPSVPGQFSTTLEAGDDVICTITNTRIGQPSIKVTKTANPTSVTEPGANVDFTVKVENTGVGAVTINTLIDDKFGDLDGQGTCDVPQVLAEGASYQCSFTGLVSGTANDVHINEVTASGVGQGQTPVEDSDTAEVTIVGRPTNSVCPPETESYEVTNIFGRGMYPGAVATVTIPNSSQATSLVAQLAGKDEGQWKYTRFWAYKGTTLLAKVNDQTLESPAWTKYAIFWYGNDFSQFAGTATKIKARLLLPKTPQPPLARALLIYPSYPVEEPIFNYFDLLEDSSKNHVHWGPSFIQSQTYVIDLPAALTEARDINIEVAIVDNDNDLRPFDLTIEAGGVSDFFNPVAHDPGKANAMLNLIKTTLYDVPEGTDQIVFTLESPFEIGDSVAMVGVTANYVCELPQIDR